MADRKEMVSHFFCACERKLPKCEIGENEFPQNFGSFHRSFFSPTFLRLTFIEFFARPPGGTSLALIHLRKRISQNQVFPSPAASIL
jgi:hypothetical protein